MKLNTTLLALLLGLGALLGACAPEEPVEEDAGEVEVEEVETEIEQEAEQVEEGAEELGEDVEAGAEEVEEDVEAVEEGAEAEIDEELNEPE